MSSPERIQQVFLKQPETFHAAPDDSMYIGQRIDTYFEETLDILNYNQRAKEVFCNIEWKTPYFEGDPDYYGNKLNPTNDRITYLKAQDKLIAFVFETRTSFNYIDVAMMCMLTPELLALLQRDKKLLNNF